jgi:hypothetical protein
MLHPKLGLISMTMLNTIYNKTNKIKVKKALKWIFSGLSIFFIAMLVIMTVHDIMIGQSSQTAEYCAKYGFLASPGCWY